MVLFCSVKIFSGSQISVASPLGNLKEYVLNGRCEETFIVTFLSQVASALQYLHENHIVHAALRAENVNVVELEEVMSCPVQMTVSTDNFFQKKTKKKHCRCTSIKRFIQVIIWLCYN